MNAACTGPLAGIRILDLTSVLMGPYATVQLGDLGADVIKVEPPEGDIVRDIGPGRTPKMGGMFLHTNRSKRSVVIDLKQPDGQAALLRLAAGVDVMIFNMRPKALARLGLDYETIKSVRPDIIFVALVGFGQDGPYAARPAYDDLIQGASGVPALVAAASDGTPRYVPVNIADRIVGLFAAQAVLAALLHRERTGAGQAIEIPMFETMTSFVLGDHFGGLTYRPPLDEGGYPRLMSRFRRPYETLDGHVCVLIYTDKHWRSFFGAIGRPDLAADPRFTNLKARLRNIDSVYGEAGRIFRTRTTAEWRALLEEADIPNMPMHTLATIQDDPHLKAVGFFEPVEHPAEGPVISMRVPSRWTKSQPRAGRPAPMLGEHSREVLAEAGLSAAEIDDLVASGAVRESGRMDATGVAPRKQEAV
jgi:crotonobetainyl-CoA:carnitine CoA-transferase CaiB-like acyl-CoA transferase